MGKPKAPKAPDYAAAATAQGAANTNSAIATNFLNQADQVGPYGSMKYTYDYQNGYTDPTTGQVIPHTTATTVLTPEQQKLLDQETGISTQLNDLASRGIGYVDQASSTPIDQSKLPGLSSGPQQRTFQTGLAAPTQGMDGRVDPTALLSQAAGTSLGIRGTPGQAGYQIGSTGSNIPLRSSFSAGSFRSSADPTRSQLSQVGGPQSYQQDADSGGPITGDVNLGGYRTSADRGNLGIQGNLNINPMQFGYDFSQAGAMPSSSDFAGQRDKITDAMMARLQPYIDKDRAALQTQMANQGLGNGTEARAWEEDKFQRGVNDQRIAALLAGDQEQQNLFNNAMGIRQQGVGEARAQGDFFNNAAQGMFSQALAAGQFGNSAQQQEFGQNEQRLQDFNQGTDANNNSTLARANFQNAAQGQRFGQGQQAMASRNAAIGQGNSDRLAYSGFNNSVQGQEFAQNQQRLENANNATGQNNQLQQQLAEFANSAQGQQYAQALQEMAARNSATGMQNQTGLDFMQAGNAAQNQQFAQNQQQFQNFNQSQNDRFSQEMARAGLANDVNNQQFQQSLAGGQFYNQGQEAMFNQGLASSQFQNQARQQAIQEADYFKNQPLNMLNALRSGNQVTMPQFGNVSAGSTIAPPPIYAAAQDQYSSALDAYKAKMANFGAILGGVSSLGGAAIGKWG